MRTNAVRNPVVQEPANGSNSQPLADATPDRGFDPQSVRSVRPAAQPRPLALRMYTEHEVSEILQVSLSQLRKWRMARNRRQGVGPPFRKIGRLVRYPEQGLQEYINGK